MNRNADSSRGGSPHNAAPVVAVRRATARDSAGLATLEATSFGAPWSRHDLAASLAEAGALGLIAVSAVVVPPHGAAPAETSSGAIRAYALFRRVLDEAELLRVAVAPEARRRGLARDLVRRGLVELAADGVRVCHLEVRAGNAAAIGLYEVLGFALAGRRAHYYADGETALLFTRPLSTLVDPPGGGCYPASGPPKGGANDAGS